MTPQEMSGARIMATASATVNTILHQACQGAILQCYEVNKYALKNSRRGTAVPALNPAGPCTRRASRYA
jgi:hypothetical protein